MKTGHGSRVALCPSWASAAGVFLAGTALAAPGGAREGGAPVLFGEERFTTDALPAGLPKAVRETLATWSAWARAHGYAIEVDPSARVLLLTLDPERRAERDRELIAATLARFDLSFGVGASGAEREGEDAGDPARERSPVVLIRVGTPTHYDALVTQMTVWNPYLGSWADSARQNTGFVHGEGAAGAWLDAPPDIEIGTVWRTDNELVNRLGQLLLEERHGDQPHWLRTAVAWSLELDVMGDIYSFPARDEFVSIADHGGWQNELANEFKGRKKEPLRYEEIVGWRRGTWDADAVPLAWGLVRFLALHRPSTLAQAAEALGRYRAEHCRITHPDGRWEIIPGYEVPAEAQVALLAEVLGPDGATEASEFFRKGKRYKPKKR